MMLEKKLFDAYDDIFGKVQVISHRVKNMMRDMGYEEYEIREILDAYMKKYPGERVNKMEINSAVNILAAEEFLELRWDKGKGSTSLKYAKRK